MSEWLPPTVAYLVVRYTSEHGAHDILFSSWHKETAEKWAKDNHRDCRIYWTNVQTRAVVVLSPSTGKDDDA